VCYWDLTASFFFVYEQPIAPIVKEIPAAALQSARGVATQGSRRWWKRQAANAFGSSKTSATDDGICTANSKSLASLANTNNTLPLMSLLRNTAHLTRHKNPGILIFCGNYFSWFFPKNN